MNKQQVEKHGEVMKWWVDNTDKGVWCNTGGDWGIVNEPTFNVHYIYVQKDEYAEFRKALVEGISVEVYNNGYFSKRTLSMWIEVTGIGEDIPPEHFRIKPKEPKFKVGDWVVFKGKISQVEENSCLALGDNDSNWKLWKPKAHEWCVFWDKCISHYIMDKYCGIDYNTPDAIQYRCSFDSFMNIAPLEFAQTLKDN